MGLAIILGSLFGWISLILVVFHLLKFRRLVKLLKDNDITF